MAKDLSALYPGKIDIDGNNPNGTFKNRTSDALKDGTPYEKGWASDVWGFLAHILKKAVVSPSGAEENEVNSQYYDALEGLVGRRKVVFETDDLIVNYDNSTEATASFKRLSLLDSNFIPKFLNDKSLTWTMPGDLELGTSEKPSHWYGMWLDSDENLRLVPDLTGTADSTVAGSIADSTAIFLTDLVHDGDIVYNLTQLTKTKASADASAEGQFTLDDDIFTSGDDYKIVKMSPEGLGENRERVGAVYNNASSNLDDSAYTQIQEERYYSESAGDFVITGDNAWTTVYGIIGIKQLLDWTGTGSWSANFKTAGTLSSSQVQTITTPLLFLNANIQAISSSQDVSTGISKSYCNAIAGAATIASGWSITGITNMSLSGSDLLLQKKPTFHN